MIGSSRHPCKPLPSGAVPKNDILGPMKTSPLSISIVAAFLLLSSCAYRAQVLRLNPTLTQADSNSTPVANGEVVLATEDARMEKEIGRRSGGTTSEAAITTDTDVAAMLREQMTSILRAKGYQVSEVGLDTLPKLTVQLSRLSYVTTTEKGKRMLRIHAELVALIKSRGYEYRQTFEAQQERQIVMEPIARSNEEWINEVLAAALKEIATDSKLYSRLSS